jgi:hypothetical protein
LFREINFYSVQILLTALATVLGGTLTLAVGQIALRGVVEPALELKRLIGTITSDLDFYANKPVEQDWRDLFRKHSCALRENLNLIIWYSFFAWAFRLPSRNNVAAAAAELMGHSNRSVDLRETAQGLGGRESEIKRLLVIRPVGPVKHKKRSGWLRLGVVVSVFWVALSVLVYFAGIVLYPSPLTNWLSRLYAWVESAPVMNRGIEFTPLYPTLQVWGLLLFTGLPLFFGWLFLFIVPRSIRWIRDGFRE